MSSIQSVISRIATGAEFDPETVLPVFDAETVAETVAAIQSAISVEAHAESAGSYALAAQAIGAHLILSGTDVTGKALAAMVGVSQGTVSAWRAFGRAIVDHGVTVSGGGFRIVTGAYRSDSKSVTALIRKAPGSVDLVAECAAMIGAAEKGRIVRAFSQAETLLGGAAATERTATKRTPAERILAHLSDAADLGAKNRDTLTDADRDAIRAALVRVLDSLTVADVTVSETVNA